MTQTRLSTFLLTCILGTAACAPAPPPVPADGEALAMATAAATWLESVSVRTVDGTHWPAIPAQPNTLSANLYSGSPGVILFYADLYRVDGQARWRDLALSGASYLAARLPAIDEPASVGLYTGLAGQCFVLQRVGATLSNEGLISAATRCFDQVVERAEVVGAGVEWGAVTDIIGGSAGIGLALLFASDVLARERYLDSAQAAGDRLLELAQTTSGGLSWEMSPDYPRTMPNFSHGTAGIAYFLASLAERTGEARFADAALAGARHLQSIADTEGDVCLIYHHEPEGENLYYLSWCHGPAGTGRLFYKLYRVTGDEEWLEWTRMAARAVIGSGIPEARPDGFWNNVGQCCGNAGVAEFLIQLHAATGESEYLTFARHVLDDVRARASIDAAGARWLQAEHRVQPDNLAAQTGFMQGAAGIGSAFLRLHGSVHGGADTTVFPDSPF